MRPWALCLAGALLLGAGLRLARLDHSLRVDEAQAWGHAQQPLGAILAEENRQPHASVLSHWSCAVLGDSEVLFRLPYVLYGILSLPLMFLLGRRLFDERVGAWGTLLLAVSVFHIQYSQEARYYAPLTFYAISGLYCLSAALTQAPEMSRAWRSAYWAGFALSHLLALSLHLFALYPAALSAAFLLAWSLDASRGRRARPIGIALCAVAALAGAALLTRPGSAIWRTIIGELAPFPNMIGAGTMTLRDSYLRWHSRPPGTSIVWEIITSFSGGPWLGAALLAAAVAGCLAAGRPRWRRSWALWLWLAVPVASLFVLRSQTHFEIRYFCFLLPVWLLLAAAGLVDGTAALAARFGAAAPHARRTLLALLTALILLLQAGDLRAYYRLPKARMREAFSHISAHGRPGDAAIFFPAWNILWYGYYSLPWGLRLYHPALLYDKSPSYSPREFVRSHERLWVAGTWIADTLRRQEFAEFQTCVERYYSLEAEAVFPSRDPNDDYRVLLFRRRPRLGPAPAAADRAGIAEEPAYRGSSFRGSPLRMMLNLPEAAQKMAASRLGFSRLLQHLALLRGPAPDAALAEASAFCGNGCVALAWSGSGRIRAGLSSSAFAAGDVFYLHPAQRLSALSAGPGEALLVLKAEDAPQTQEPGEAGLSLLARLGPGPDSAAAPVPKGSTLLRDGPLAAFSSRRLKGTWEAPILLQQSRWHWATAIVLQGRVHVENTDGFFSADLRPGDVYEYPTRWLKRRSDEKPAPADSLELLLADVQKRRRPADMVISSSTGKVGGLLPPMLLP